MIVLSAEMIGWVLIGGASLCAFMIGKLIGQKEHDQTIENTINYLIDEGFLRYKKVNGEIEIIKLNDE